MRPASLATLLAAATLVTLSHTAIAQRYSEVDLISDIAGRAARLDTNLVNPWGVAPGGSGTFWVSDNGKGVSTLYQPDGAISGLVVSIPGGPPTGVVFASPADSAFTIPSADTTARAIFIFVTEEGTIAAWSPTLTPTAAIEVAATPEAIYLGVALGGTGDGSRLYAANFHTGAIDIFNRHFQAVTIAGSFVDPGLPAGYGPFNIANIDGQLYVAYAQQDANHEDEVPGPGLGIVDVFDLNGTFVRRLISNGGALNAPWAIVKAPPAFGAFGGDFLVGNFGDGMINAFDSNGAFVGAVQDTFGNPRVIPGLWGLSFGRLASGPEVANRLYFAAGIADETHGLFGYLAPFRAAPPPPPPPPVACGGGEPHGVGFWRHLCGGPAEGSRGKSEEHVGDNRRGLDHTPPDSLQALFGCISEASHTFGSSGCFTAGCDLLARHGRMETRDRLAQKFLTLLLNRCSGRICDTVTVHCEDEDGDDDGGGGIQSPHTVGDIIAFVDENLCAGTNLAEVRRLLGCANESEGDDDDDDDDAIVSNNSFSRGKISVQPIGSNPYKIAGAIGARFAISTPTASVVRLRIYDTAGRLIAEPLRDGTVSGLTIVRWDGRDTRGALVAPGTYFYRATTGEAAANGRLIVIH
jgi:uncharacterized protein (TIGR03118 family)